MTPVCSRDEDDLQKTFVQYFQSEPASVKIEYSMIAVLVAVSLFGVRETIGGSVGEGYANIANVLISMETIGSIK